MVSFPRLHRRPLGAALAALGIAAAGLGFAAAPAVAAQPEAFQGVCTPSTPSTGTCIVDEINGGDPATHGTATYEVVGDELVVDFAGVVGGTGIQACVTVDDGQTNPYLEPAGNRGAWQPCSGDSDDRIYEGEHADHLVLDLLLVPTWEPGDAVFFALHVNQSGMTTYVLGGGTPGEPLVVDVCTELEGDQPEGTDCDPVVDVCPALEGEQQEGTDCDPVVDVCPELEGEQPEGTDCDPVVDVCSELEGDQPEGTDCDPPSGCNELEDVRAAAVDECEPTTVDACVDVEGEQPEGTDCDPPVVDACPLLDGTQAEGADCEPVTRVVPQVLDNSPARPSVVAATQVARSTEVAGVQAVRQLPRTGSDSANLLLLAVGLLTTGLGLVLLADPRRVLAVR